MKQRTGTIQKAKNLTSDSCRNASGERGYMLAVLAVFTSVLLVTLSAAVINWQKAIQREREEELIFRGRQFMRAIELWHRKFPGTFPTTVDALLSTNNTRFLRKKWKDPITNAFDWRFIKMGPDGSIQGLSPLSGVSPSGSSPYDSQSQAKSNSLSAGAQSLNGSPASGSGYGVTQGTSGNQAGGNVGGLSTQSQNRSSSAPFTPVLGGIVGVASSSEKESIKSFNGKSKYSEWEFVFFTGGSVTGGGGLPQGQNPSGNIGPGQAGGGASSPGAVPPAPRPLLPGRSPMP